MLDQAHILYNRFANRMNIPAGHDISWNATDAQHLHKIGPTLKVLQDVSMQLAIQTEPPRRLN